MWEGTHRETSEVLAAQEYPREVEAAAGPEAEAKSKGSPSRLCA